MEPISTPTPPSNQPELLVVCAPRAANGSGNELTTLHVEAGPHQVLAALCAWSAEQRELADTLPPTLRPGEPTPLEPILDVSLFRRGPDLALVVRSSMPPASPGTLDQLETLLESLRAHGAHARALH